MNADTRVDQELKYLKEMGSVCLISSSDYSFYLFAFHCCTSLSPSPQSAVTLCPSEQNDTLPAGSAPAQLLLMVLRNSSNSVSLLDWEH